MSQGSKMKVSGCLMLLCPGMGTAEPEGAGKHFTVLAGCPGVPRMEREGGRGSLGRGGSAGVTATRTAGTRRGRCWLTQTWAGEMGTPHLRAG